MKGTSMVTKPVPRSIFLALIVSFLYLNASGSAALLQGPKPKDAPARWKELIGEYALNGDTIYVLEANQRLTLLMKTPDRRVPLRELSENVFRAEERSPLPDTAIIFTRTANGRGASFAVGTSTYKRLAVGPEEGSVFRIKPLRPIDVLRHEALRARPPREKGNFRKADLVELTKLDPTIKLDIRYATKNNFMGEPLYSEAKAFMQRPAAEALVRAHRWLKQWGYGILVHDAYRPWYVTKMFWDATPNDEKAFVANPAKGSMHNRGCAADITLYDLKTGKPVEMVSGYDEFSHRAFPDYPGGTSLERWHRALLRRAMEMQGFTVYQWEWWHFDYKGWKHYAIGNQTFEEIH